jgi:hypothetical protein
VDVGIAKLKEYYSKTGGPVETQYALAAMLDVTTLTVTTPTTRLASLPRSNHMASDTVD